MKLRVFDTYKKAMFVAHASWVSTAGIVLARAFQVIPQQFGTLAVLTLGFGVASSVSISRFRLTDAITQVFRIGLTADAPPSDHKYADELIHHLSSCNTCKGGTTVARKCPRGRDLVRLTLAERHPEKIGYDQ